MGHTNYRKSAGRFGENDGEYDDTFSRPSGAPRQPKAIIYQAAFEDIDPRTGLSRPQTSDVAEIVTPKVVFTKRPPRNDMRHGVNQERNTAGSSRFSHASEERTTSDTSHSSFSEESEGTSQNSRLQQSKESEDKQKQVRPLEYALTAKEAQSLSFCDDVSPSKFFPDFEDDKWKDRPLSHKETPNAEEYSCYSDIADDDDLLTSGLSINFEDYFSDNDDGTDDNKCRMTRKVDTSFWDDDEFSLLIHRATLNPDEPIGPAQQHGGESGWTLDALMASTPKPRNTKQSNQDPNRGYQAGVLRQVRQHLNNMRGLRVVKP
jgi:hypothetical protein